MNAVDQSNCVEMEANDFNFVVDENGVRSALQEYKEIAYLSELTPKQRADIIKNFEK